MILMLYLNNFWSDQDYEYFVLCYIVSAFTFRYIIQVELTFVFV